MVKLTEEGESEFLPRRKTKSELKENSLRSCSRRRKPRLDCFFALAILAVIILLSFLISFSLIALSCIFAPVVWLSFFPAVEPEESDSLPLNSIFWTSGSFPVLTGVESGFAPLGGVFIFIFLLFISVNAVV